MYSMTRRVLPAPEGYEGGSSGNKGAAGWKFQTFYDDPARHSGHPTEVSTINAAAAEGLRPKANKRYNCRAQFLGDCSA
jgi:hypothetical protein